MVKISKKTSLNFLCKCQYFMWSLYIIFLSFLQALIGRLSGFFVLKGFYDTNKHITRTEDLDKNSQKFLRFIFYSVLALRHFKWCTSAWKDYFKLKIKLLKFWQKFFKNFSPNFLLFHENHVGFSKNQIPKLKMLSRFYVRLPSRYPIIDKLCNDQSHHNWP